jgi:hypothetical protein
MPSMGEAVVADRRSSAHTVVAADLCYYQQPHSPGGHTGMVVQRSRPHELWRQPQPGMSLRPGRPCVHLSPSHVHVSHVQ